MSAMSDYLEQKLLEHIFKNTSFTSPTTVYLALFTAAPSDSGGGTEVSGGSYARKAITFAAASSPGGTIANSATVQFDVATANWGTITHFGIFDASSAGNLLVHGALTASKTVNSGDRIDFNTGDIVVTFA